MITGKSWIRTIIVFMSVALTSCVEDTNSKGDAPKSSLGSVILLEQNWTHEDREFSWFTSFGSRVMPYEWFRVIEAEDAQRRLADEESLAEFGFISVGVSKANPDGFPIGFTVSGNENDLRWVGLGCSACHSGPVYFEDQLIHVDGGGAMIEFHRFENAVIGSLNATLADEEKFARFKKALGTRNGKRLRAELEAWTEQLEKRREINRTKVSYGFGRLDAFGQIFNSVATEALGIPENRIEPDAPVSFPVLWDASHLNMVQWNASAPNAGPGPLIQNATTAIAVFGHVNVNSSGVGYRSSIEVGNLGKIQDTWYKLTAPSWPEAILGRLDPNLISAGSIVYSRECLSCHALVDSSDEDREVYAYGVPASEVGTDPKMVDNFSNSRVKSGAFEGKKVLFAVGPEIQPEEHPITLVAHATVGALMHSPIESITEGLTSLHKVYSSDVNANATVYKARPLNGIWSSAPYLHNGSVPTLMDMLTPPEGRSESFAVGKVEFDPLKVGLSQKVISENQASNFDTRVTGNSNSGHLYGTGLSDDEKRSLLEYLKSL